MATDDLIAGRRRTPNGHEHQRVGGRRAGVGAQQRPARGGFVRDRITAFTGALTAGCAVLCIAVLARPGTSTRARGRGGRPSEVGRADLPARLRHLPRRRSRAARPSDRICTASAPPRSTSSCRPGACRCRPAMRPRSSSTGLGLRGAGSSPTEVQRRHPARPRRLRRGPHRRRTRPFRTSISTPGTSRPGGRSTARSARPVTRGPVTAARCSQREAPSTHPATPTEIAEAVRAGPGNMPAFGHAAVDDEQLQSLRAVRPVPRPPRRPRRRAAVAPRARSAEGAVAVFVGLGLLVLAVRWIGTRS